MIALLTAAFQAIANAFGWAGKRSDEKNRDDVVKGQVAQNENAAQDKAAKEVANQDIEAIRKELSE